MSKLSRITWLTFGGIILVHFLSFGLGMVLFEYDGPWEILVFLPLWPVGWLDGIFSRLGFDTIGKSNEFMALPNTFGYILIITGTLISLVIYYLIARKIAHHWINKRIDIIK